MLKIRWTHPDELEADFQQYYGLDVAQVDHKRVARLLFQLPNQCRLFAALVPGTQWGWSEVLANKANHLLEVLIWLKSKDAQKKRPQNKPKPFVPDFMKQPSPINDGAEAQTVDDVKSWLDAPRG